MRGGQGSWTTTPERGQAVRVPRPSPPPGTEVGRKWTATCTIGAATPRTSRAVRALFPFRELVASFSMYSDHTHSCGGRKVKRHAS